MPSLHTCIWWKTWHLRSLSHIGSVATHIAGDWAQSFCQVFKSKKKKHWKLSPDSHIVINCSFQPCNIHPYNMTKIPRSLRCVISDCQVLKFKSRQPHVLIPTFYPQGSRKKKAGDRKHLNAIPNKPWMDRSGGVKNKPIKGNESTDEKSWITMWLDPSNKGDKQH